jgi:hypothetical protein
MPSRRSQWARLTSCGTNAGRETGGSACSGVWTCALVWSQSPCLHLDQGRRELRRCVSPGSPNGVRTRVSTLRVISVRFRDQRRCANPVPDLRVRYSSRPPHFLTSPGRSRDKCGTKVSRLWAHARALPYALRPDLLARSRPTSSGDARQNEIVRGGRRTAIHGFRRSCTALPARRDRPLRGRRRHPCSAARRAS